MLHSPDFVSPPHRTGADVITVHDLSFLVVPECAEPKLAGFLSKTRARGRTAGRRDNRGVGADEARSCALDGRAPEKVTVVYNGVDERFGQRGAEIVDEKARVMACGRNLVLPERFVLHVGTLSRARTWLG